MTLRSAVVLANVRSPLYLGDHTINCWVPQVSADMYLDTRDRGIVGHLCRGRGWEEGVTKTFMRTVGRNWTVADVGANFGWYTLHFANALRSTGRLIAVEASPRTHDLLATTLENAGLLGDPVRLHNVAAADAPGVVAFTSQPDRALNNHIVQPGTAEAVAASTVSVRAVTLDSLLMQVRRHLAQGRA